MVMKPTSVKPCPAGIFRGRFEEPQNSIQDKMSSGKFGMVPNEPSAKLKVMLTLSSRTLRPGEGPIIVAVKPDIGLAAKCRIKSI